MKLNLEVLFQDFADLGAHCSLHESARECTLEYAVAFDDEDSVSPNCLYLAQPGQISPELYVHESFSPSFVMTGKPTDEELESKANFLWFEPALPLLKVARLVLERFEFYNTWERKLLESVTRNDPIRKLGELSEPVFQRPLFMWDSLFQTVFAVWDESHYDLPKGYLKHEDKTVWPIDELNAVDHRLVEGQENRGIYILPPVFGYRSMCANIFLQGAYVATISIDEIGSPFTRRDELLLGFLAKHLNDSLRSNSDTLTSMTYSMRHYFDAMLNMDELDKQSMRAELARQDWMLTDTYCCIVAVPENPCYSDERLAICADAVSRLVDNTLFAIHEHAIVFVIDQSMLSRDPEDEVETRKDTAAKILGALETSGILAAVGISNSYHNFFDTIHFYHQARWAIGIGNSASPSSHLFLSDEYLFDRLAQVATNGTIAQTLCPDGLTRLSHYDQLNGTNLVATLETYLDNNQSATKSANALFMHRNTFNKRLELIRDVGQMDLDDPMVRLSIKIGIRLLDYQERKRS